MADQVVTSRALVPVNAAGQPLSGPPLSGLTRIALGASALLSALVAAGAGTAAISATLCRLALVPVSGAVVNLRFDGAAAATTSYPTLPAGGIEFVVRASDAAALRLIGSGSVDVWQFG